jgi:hypothetical protein
MIVHLDLLNCHDYLLFGILSFKLFIYIQLVLVHPHVYLVFIQVSIYLFRFAPCLVNMALHFGSYVHIRMSKCWSLLLGFTDKCKKEILRIVRLCQKLQIIDIQIGFSIH